MIMTTMLAICAVTDTIAIHKPGMRTHAYMLPHTHIRTCMYVLWYGVVYVLWYGMVYVLWYGMVYVLWYGMVYVLWCRMIYVLWYGIVYILE